MKTIQIRITRTYYKEAFINVEVEDGEANIDFLIEDETIDNKLEGALANVDFYDGDTDYEWTDLEDNNGGHL